MFVLLHNLVDLCDFKYNSPPTSLENLLPPSAEPHPRAIPGQVPYGENTGGEVIAGKVGKSECGDFDDVMEQMSENGAEKLPELPTSVTVSGANIDELVLLFQHFCVILSLTIPFPILIQFIPHSPQMNKDKECIVTATTEYGQASF